MDRDLKIHLQMTQNLLKLMIADFDKAGPKAIKKCLRLLLKELDDIIRMF